MNEIISFMSACTNRNIRSNKEFASNQLQNDKVSQTGHLFGFFGISTFFPKTNFFQISSSSKPLLIVRTSLRPKKNVVVLPSSQICLFWVRSVGRIYFYFLNQWDIYEVPNLEQVLTICRPHSLLKGWNNVSFVVFEDQIGI